jgi:hypothetical protein
MTSRRRWSLGWRWGGTRGRAWGAADSVGPAAAAAAPVWRDGASVTKAGADPIALKVRSYNYKNKNKNIYFPSFIVKQ